MIALAASHRGDGPTAGVRRPRTDPSRKPRSHVGSAALTCTAQDERSHSVDDQIILGHVGHSEFHTMGEPWQENQLGYKKIEESIKDFGYGYRGDEISNDFEYRDSNSLFLKQRQRGDQNCKGVWSFKRHNSINGYRDKPVGCLDGQERRDSVERQRGEPGHERYCSSKHDNYEEHDWNGSNVASAHWSSPENGIEQRSKSLSENPPGYGNDSSPAESRPTKLKLKVGGITHTIVPSGRRPPELGKHPNTGQLKLPGVGGSAIKKPTASARTACKQHASLQEFSDDDGYAFPKSEGYIGKNRIPLRGGFREKDTPPIDGTMLGTMDSSNVPSQAIRKSSRIPKKRVLDGDEDVTDLRKRNRKVEQDSDYQYPDVADDEDDDLESIWWEQNNGKRRKRIRGESESSPGGGKKIALTARQRSLQSSKESVPAEIGTSLIEFPEGLTHNTSKKKKDVLSETEQQLKKEEAAKKRRQQVEKNAKEIQEVAIQKILGQDSQRKKREDKLQKQREEMEQERKVAAMAIPSNCIRWVMGPSGTVVSFSHDIELPNIFSGPCTYPKERERCAAPSCSNVYKYRDSKSSLPICSLQCYKEVQNQVASAH